MHQLVEAPNPPDMWKFHEDEPDYRRELSSAETFRLYAISPFTKRVTYFKPTLEAPPELRAYGPQNSFVWLVLPREELTEQLRAYLKCLCWRLYQEQGFEVT